MTTARTAAVGFGAGVLGSVLTVAVIGAAPETRVPNQVKSREFVLIDENNNRRLVIGFANDAPRITFYSRKLDPRIVITSEEGGPATVALAGAGPPTVTLSADPEGTSMVMVGRRNDDAAALVSPGGSGAGLVITNKGGTIAAGPTEEHGNLIQVADGDGKVKFRSSK